MTTSLAVVTGAASGIGFALSQELAARGNDVIAIDWAPPPFRDAPRITALQADVSDAAAMQRIAAAFARRPLAYLFANAGIAAPGSVFGASAQDWQHAWAVNTLGPLHTLRSWWPHLEAAGGSAIVTVSAAALLAYPGAPLYRTTKAALLSLLEGLYYETRDSGVTLHALCPGLVQSGILDNARLRHGAALADTPLTRYLDDALRRAEPARDFARRVLDDLAAEPPPPFYWLPHPDTRAGVEQRQYGVLDGGHPTLAFGAAR
ncbi:hypothetical protein OTERR_21010 [Oryzomicrobium terrae]|uniref:Uncharacterized protein n=1 Tax=Oryzomicrobium terrae TaxID=1735038 RepID=A0A5C1EBL6_9RHOO|nr:SDR family oxidoreductase [Oryzomicrobium terrae]QEL65577.1 hypothetical protein OTERR_21010 [Oryzomicrobium terrae]